MYQRSLLWIRRDLRSHDHRAWSEAEALSQQIAVVFVFDKNILEKLENRRDRRLTFIYKSLRELRETLRACGSELVVRFGDPLVEIPAVARTLDCQAVFANRDYEPYARARDRAVEHALKNNAVDFLSCKDHVIFASEELRNASGAPFKVFTPYFNAWKKKLSPADLREAKVTLKNLWPASATQGLDQGLELQKAGFAETELCLPSGSSGGKKLFAQFRKEISAYQKQRDFPALARGTSHLSVHFRFGTLSVREVLRKIGGDESAGAEIWKKELVWRDFYQMLLASFPELPGGCFQSKYNALQWPGSQKDFHAWCVGQTGYPLIDAAMRHFNKSGWMHNRLRMIVASFLTKDLLCHWKWGEKYFADNLLDFDLAANNGGWQWAASVGCDAQPYFRIFNPITQSERFDPAGTFIRGELPELRALPDQYIHAPWKAPAELLQKAGIALGKNYPHPLVDHAKQRDKAIKLFR